MLSTDQLADSRRSTPAFATLHAAVVLRAEGGRAAGGGTRLGPLGGLIVGGVIVGLLLADPNSYLSAAPGWKPTLGKTPGTFAMTDLLDYAGVGGVR